MNRFKLYAVAAIAGLAFASTVSAGMSLFSNFGSGTTQPLPTPSPSAPINLICVGISTNQIQLTWSQGTNVAPVVGTYVRAYTNASPPTAGSTNGFFMLSVVPWPSTNFVDSLNLGPNQTRWYVLQSYN